MAENTEGTETIEEDIEDEEYEKNPEEEDYPED